MHGPLYLSRNIKIAEKKMEGREGVVAFVEFPIFW